MRFPRQFCPKMGQQFTHAISENTDTNYPNLSYRILTPCLRNLRSEFLDTNSLLHFFNAGIRLNFLIVWQLVLLARVTCGNIRNGLKHMQRSTTGRKWRSSVWCMGWSCEKYDKSEVPGSKYCVLIRNRKFMKGYTIISIPEKAHRLAISQRTNPMA